MVHMEVIITRASEAIHAAEVMIMHHVSVASDKGDEFMWWRVEKRSRTPCRPGNRVTSPDPKRMRAPNTKLDYYPP